MYIHKFTYVTAHTETCVDKESDHTTFTIIAIIKNLNQSEKFKIDSWYQRLL